MKVGNKTIILTAGNFDVKILQCLLPTSILEKTVLVPSTGFSGAISKAKSFAIQLTNKIILVLDADTFNDDDILEKRDNIEYIFKSIGKEDNVDLFLFKPYIEIIFAESNVIKNQIRESKNIPTNWYGFNELEKIKKDKSILQTLTKEEINHIRINSSLKLLIELINKSVKTEYLLA